MRLFCVWLLLLSTGTLSAIQSNHYVLGTNGLRSATRPDGYVYSNIFTYYKAGKIKGNQGQTLIDDSTFIQCIDQNIFQWNSDYCFLGGKYGCMIDIPFNNIALDIPLRFSILNTHSQFALGDLYVEPINFRWTFDHLDLIAAYGFYATTGKFKSHSTHNNGLGNWGNQLTLAGTYYFDCEKTWSLSAYTTYEIHCKKRNVNIRPGDNLCIDWGFGKLFAEWLTVGVVGYAEWMTTYDSGSDINFLIQGKKDRVYAIGPEIDLAFPIGCSFGSIALRSEKEFDTHLRTQGYNIVGNFSHLF